jgi:hypothetical protein
MIADYPWEMSANWNVTVNPTFVLSQGGVLLITGGVASFELTNDTPDVQSIPINLQLEIVG